MVKWPKLENLKQLKMLEKVLQEICQRFWFNAQPLTLLLKKDNMNWNPKTDFLFQKLKLAVCSPVLALLDFSQLYVVETNACYGGVGAIFIQNRRLIA